MILFQIVVIIIHLLERTNKSSHEKQRNTRICAYKLMFRFTCRKRRADADEYQERRHVVEFHFGFPIRSVGCLGDLYITRRDTKCQLFVFRLCVTWRYLFSCCCRVCVSSPRHISGSDCDKELVT